MKKSNSQTIVVLSGYSVIDDGSVMIEQEVEEENVKHSTPVVRGKKQDLNEAVSQQVSSRPTRAAAAKVLPAEEPEGDSEEEMEQDEEEGDGDKEVVTRTRGRPARVTTKAGETEEGDEEGSSPTRKSTRTRK